MTDLREIQVLENSFELAETMAQNEQMTKANKHLIYFGLTVSVLLIVTIIFIVKNKPSEDPAREDT